MQYVDKWMAFMVRVVIIQIHKQHGMF
jgi:hypothetical protein